jgi:ppGpp synthetase/RelA/SpoT-type nucleotidyltranferase
MRQLGRVVGRGGGHLRRAGETGEARGDDRTSRDGGRLPRGLPLGARLGLATSLIVVVVIGGHSVSQLRQEALRERAEREELLAQALAPLAAQVEAASSPSEVRALTAAFSEAFALRRHPAPRLVVRDRQGRALGQTTTGPAAAPDDLAAAVALRSGVAAGGRIEARQSGAALAAHLAVARRDAAVDLAVTVLCILLCLLVAGYYYVSRPLGRLVSALQRLSLGHLASLEAPAGAREIRWLAWRFRALGIELEETVARLVEAERRALTASANPDLGLERPASAAETGPPTPPAQPASLRRDLLRQHLRDRCRLLEGQPKGSEAARALAREAWDHDAVEAGKLGDTRLRARLEDAAMRVLYPDDYDRAARELAELRDARQRWAKDIEAEMRRALDDDGVPCEATEYRVKHVAGVFRKMRAKGLSLEQVNDLFAFRLIVPDEPDCYRALKAVHERFKPRLLRFKDYIARPKPNGYRSLHTCLRDADGTIFEVQIRSSSMHEDAEAGHWRYKAVQCGHSPELS